VVVAQVAELRLGEQFCGPAASANGGYACGVIAELLGGGVEVTCAGRRRSAGRCGCGSALLDAHGRVLAVARTVWVTIPRPEPAP
jgi:hypothetical protein